MGDQQDQSMKVYVKEIFEEYLGQNVTLGVGPALGEEMQAISPKAHEFMNLLNIREAYPKISDDLNTFKFLAGKYRGGQSGDLAFRMVQPQSSEDFCDWQEQVRAKIRELLHIPFPAIPLDAEWDLEGIYDGIVYQKVYYMSQPGVKVAAILVHREDLDLRTRHPAVITLHGHNPGKVCTTGFSRSGSDSNYGRELAQRGFVTLILDQFGWGERYGVAAQRMGNSEHAFALSSLIVGLNAVGLRTWDASKGIDLLETLDYVDPARIATCGHSGGGTTSLFCAVTDPRVKGAIVSGYFNTFSDSIFSLSHCGCNYVQDIALHSDIADLLGSRAPLPVFIVSGERDIFYPKQGVRVAYDALAEIYAIAGASENFQADIMEGVGHMFSGRKAYPWLDEALELNS
jgi:dienelactone hydrolase